MINTIKEIPQYGLRAYALFFSKHGSKETFMQSELDWIVSTSMKKKLFSLLVRNGWIKKHSRNEYICINPEVIFKGILDFKIPEIMKEAKRDYAFTGLSAVEIWSDYSYVQRGIEKSPYFIDILKKDLKYWKELFSKNNVPYYINEGSTIGEYAILLPLDKLKYSIRNGFKVISLKKTLKIAENNKMHSYAYGYIRRKYGKTAA